MRLVILTGASGSGKSTIAAALGASSNRRIHVIHFDSVGVPDPAAMIAGWGSGEAWQEAMTARWMMDIKALVPLRQSILFEGQIRPSYLPAAVAGLGCDSRVLLLDCSDEVRRRRLRVERRQPDLASEHMMRWAAVMQAEADELGFARLDTTSIKVGEAVEAIAKLFDK
jgi:RNase adaptor protein for sRNA GlmZ degradation